MICFNVKQFKVSSLEDSVVEQKYVNNILLRETIELPRMRALFAALYAARIGRLKNHRAIWLTAFANENFINPRSPRAQNVFLACETSAARYCKINHRA